MRFLKYSRAVGVVVLAVAVGAGGLLLWKARHGSPPAATAPVWTPVSQEHLSHGRFETINAFVPHAPARGFVVLLSGAAGWNTAMATMAEAIAAHGALVAGIDVTRFDASLATDAGQCVYPDGDLENLSHFVQAYYRLPTYLSPILVGDGSGGTLAYASLIQAPSGTFGGAVSIDFCPEYPLSKPLCKGSGIEFAQKDPGVSFLPSPREGLSWRVLQRAAACPGTDVPRFVAGVPDARIAQTAGDGTRRLQDAIDSLMAAHPGTPNDSLPSAVSDLPLITIPAQAGTTPSTTFAIVLSGDGGWAGLDKEVAGALSAAGIPVVGLDSLRYFWTARTPEGLAHDIDRITAAYAELFKKERVLLIGYSQGADVLPFGVNRLAAATRSRVAITAVMGMSEHALFEFHMSSWIADDDSGPATLPEMDKITGMPLLCIYGSEEVDTLCPKLDSRKATIVKLKGGHHFDGDYAGLARIILGAASK